MQTQDGNQKTAGLSNSLSFLEKYTNALLSGNGASASSVIGEALASGTSPIKAYVSILVPAQIEVGKLWSDSGPRVSEEHRVTQITLAEMARLRPLIKPLSRLGVKAVISTLDGEDHWIGGRIIADFLFIDGWDVHFLGPNTTTKDLLALIESEKFDLVGLTSSKIESLDLVKDAVSKIKTISPLTKIILSGDSIYANQESAGTFKADGIAFDADEAVILARNLCNVRGQDAALSYYLKGLGERIVTHRKARKFSQHKLAESAGLDRAYISSVENGKQNVTIGAIVKLATALDIGIEDLLIRAVER